MHLTRITSAKSVGFQASALYPRKEAPYQTLRYLKQRSSFFVASLSLIAFIAGNTMGKHGWYAFCASLFAKYDDSIIVYNGTVPPIALVPDYSKWSMYGGDPEQHMYRQVPKDVLIPLPTYDSAKQRAVTSYLDNLYFSVGDRGSYETGAEHGGSHPGIDIRVPIGTPVRSIANGIVESVKEDRGGYGLYVVIRHPNVPDPAHPSRKTVLHSIYAHLSAQLVSEGDIVNKGQEIALSGQTGFATGPHVHFQIDTDSAPYHPYWPFTMQEAANAGYSFMQAINNGLNQERLALYTVNPMTYVQADYAAPTKIADAASSSSSSQRVVLTLRERAAQVRSQRLQRSAIAGPIKVTNIAALPQSQIVSQKIVSINDAAPLTPVIAPAAAPVVPMKTVTIQTDGSFSGGWEKIVIRLVGENGEPADASTLAKPLYLRTAYGDAQFRPAILKSSDFTKGAATVEMLALGRRTVVVKVEPLGVISDPITYQD